MQLEGTVNHAARAIRVAVVTGILLSTATVSPAAAADQAYWAYRSNAACAGNLPAGYLNFCRVGGYNYNGTENRDSNLRSGDTYVDNYRIGTVTGVSPNTSYVTNQFSNAAAYVCFYTDTDYVGAFWRTGKSGLRIVYPGTNGLMSMRSC